MVRWHRSPSLCVETAVHYELQAERSADPVARQKFLDLAYEWRKSAVIYESEEIGLVPSDTHGASEEAALAPLSAENDGPAGRGPAARGAAAPEMLLSGHNP